MRNIFLTVILLLSTMVASVQAVTRNVPSQYPTIQAAINACENGDTVIVADGIYTEPGNRDIDFNGKAITVRSENGPENCVIDCEGTSADPHRGFHFNSGETTDSVLSGVTITNGHGGIEFEIIGHGGAVFCENGSSPTITNCVFSNNSAAVWSGGGVANWDGSCPTIMNCMFIENYATGGGGMDNHGGSNPLLINCTFVGNVSPLGAGLANYESFTTIRNCIFWNEPHNEIHVFEHSGSVDITFSDIQGGWPGVGNIDGDPRFANPSIGDYHLLPDSPCINTGDPSGDYSGQTDIDGEPRVMDGRADIGADEFTGALPEEPECPELPVHEPWRFVQISDTHIGSSEEARTNLALLVNKVINEIHPDFIVNTGDIVDWGCANGLWGEYCKNDFYKSYSSAMRLATNAGIHVYNIPGNHDQKLGQFVLNPCDSFSPCFDDPLGNRDNEFLLGHDVIMHNDVMFPVLNTGTGNCQGSLNADDISFLRGLNPCVPKIILTHHPAVAGASDRHGLANVCSIGSLPQHIDEGQDEFLDYCEEKSNNVYMVLSGHTHTNRVYDRNLGTPTDYPWYVLTGPTKDGYARVISFQSPPTEQSVQLTSEDYNYTSAKLRSPGNLHAYDSDGYHTGYNADSGSEYGIPQSVYFSNYVFETEEGPVFSPEEVMILDPTDDYLWGVVGTEEGTYGLDITYVDRGEKFEFKAVNIPTSLGSKHIYAVNWQALSAGEKEAVIIEVDSDGDGTFERTISADSELTAEEFRGVPVADAGSDETVLASLDGIAEVTLDGSGSSDPDGDDLTYKWTWTVEGIACEATGVNPTIKLPIGTHNINLVVNDGTQDSESDEVIVDVIGPVPIDDLVDTSLGRMRYDRRTRQFILNATVTNFSARTVVSPVGLVIDNISNPAVTLANSDGTTEDGTEYIDLSGLLGDGELEPGESIVTSVCFNNSRRVRFTCDFSVRGIPLPTP